MSKRIEIWELTIIGESGSIENAWKLLGTIPEGYTVHESKGSLPTYETTVIASLGWLDGGDKKLMIPKAIVVLTVVEKTFETVIRLLMAFPTHWSPALIFLFNIFLHLTNFDKIKYCLL